MKIWPSYPVIYEVNTWVWLGELSRKAGKPVNLATVPEQEWDSLASPGIDAVWFMGVWERSPAGIEISTQNEALTGEFRRVLPDFTTADNVGSPYCVHRYVVDRHLGGPPGLALAREKLAKRDVRLILDYVPNHVAPDHPWVAGHPEYFIRGTDEDLRRDPASFIATEGRVLACGRDPYFPAWQDVLQLNVFDLGLRQAVLDTVLQIADQCDGVRCDMAMLVMNDIFERTWGPRAGTRPAEDFWPGLIPAIRSHHPEFRFIAEAYWDLEWALQQQGFDFCYDKKLYDRMEHAPAESVRLHLTADMSYQKGLVRFLENHDEPRAAATFPDGKARAAAVAILTLPGARLLHEGQFEGRRVRLPVFLRRRPEEPPDTELEAFYRTLLSETKGEIFREGLWKLCERTGWPEDESCLNILAWSVELPPERYLIVINFSDASSRASVHPAMEDLRGRTWRLSDPLSGELYERDGSDMADHGLFVSLASWRWHFFRMDPV